MARPRFYGFNRRLFHLSLRGLGVLNSQNFSVSGEHRFLKSYLGQRQQPVVLDVGAHVGTYARQVLQVAPDAQVYAFEPHPETFQQLKGKLEATTCRVINAGMNDIPGIFDLYDHMGAGSQQASMFSEAIADYPGAELRRWPVEMITLDAFVAAEGLSRVDLLKLDVEGNELKVLRGAANTIKRCGIDAIHLEFNSMNVVSRSFVRDFRAILHGFTLYRMLVTGLLCLEPYDPVMSEIFAYQNLVALRDGAP